MQCSVFLLICFIPWKARAGKFVEGQGAPLQGKAFRPSFYGGAFSKDPEKHLEEKLEKWDHQVARWEEAWNKTAFGWKVEAKSALSPEEDTSLKKTGRALVVYVTAKWRLARTPEVAQAMAQEADEIQQYCSAIEGLEQKAADYLARFWVDVASSWRIAGETLEQATEGAATAEGAAQAVATASRTTSSGFAALEAPEVAEEWEDTAVLWQTTCERLQASQLSDSDEDRDQSEVASDAATIGDSSVYSLEDSVFSAAAATATGSSVSTVKWSDLISRQQEEAKASDAERAAAIERAKKLVRQQGHTQAAVKEAAEMLKRLNINDIRSPIKKTHTTTQSPDLFAQTSLDIIGVLHGALRNLFVGTGVTFAMLKLRQIASSTKEFPLLV